MTLNYIDPAYVIPGSAAQADLVILAESLRRMVEARNYSRAAIAAVARQMEPLVDLAQLQRQLSGADVAFAERQRQRDTEGVTRCAAIGLALALAYRAKVERMSRAEWITLRRAAGDALTVESRLAHWLRRQGYDMRNTGYEGRGTYKPRGDREERQ